jgi:hypothetical protein
MSNDSALFSCLFGRLGTFYKGTIWVSAFKRGMSLYLVSMNGYDFLQAGSYRVRGTGTVVAGLAAHGSNGLNLFNGTVGKVTRIGVVRHGKCVEQGVFFYCLWYRSVQCSFVKVIARVYESHSFRENKPSYIAFSHPGNCRFIAAVCLEFSHMMSPLRHRGCWLE